MSDLKAWREAQEPKKISQTKLAELLGTTQSHVCQIEQNEDGISLELAGKIFAVTGVRIGRLKQATDQQARTVSEMTGAQ